MSRFVSVCLCAIVALVSLIGAPFLRPAPAFAASGTLSMETPLHESPAHGAPLIALLVQGDVVSIDGPPVDGFYPVTAGNLSGWMRGENLQVEKDALELGATVEPPLENTDGMAPIAQTVDGETASGEIAADLDLATGSATSVVVDPSTDPALTAQPPPDGSGVDTTLIEPVGDVTSGDQNAKAVGSTVDAAAATDDSAPTTEVSQVQEVAPLDELAPVDAAAAATAPVVASQATPVAVDPDGEIPPADSVSNTLDAAAEPTTDPIVTPIPVVEVPPAVGPASVMADAPIREGPGPNFALIFTVPMGSTLEQTGRVTDGYVSAQYKEVIGWVALEQLGPPSSFVEETPPAETAATTETPATETSPTDTPSTQTPTAETSSEEAAVEVRTPRAGSGVAYTTVDMSLRSGPSATEEPITVVPAGSRVDLTGVMEGGFQRVTYKDQIGWIADEYLETPRDPKPEPRRNGKQQYTRQQIINIINEAADRYDQSRSAMLRVAECESNLDPYAVNPSGSYGLFQFIRSTWESTPYGNKDIFDPVANANAAAWMWSEGRKSEWVCQ